MTSRELLEAAAKAAGIELLGTSWGMSEEGDFLGFAVAGEKTWNPLVDDGDAFRLLVKLQLAISLDYREVEVWSYSHEHSDVTELIGDPYASTRRAIVRAAAKIGEGDE